MEQGEALDGAFAALREPAQFLTRFAVDPRSPGAVHEPDQQLAEAALQRAREVLRFVLAHLPMEVHP